MTEVKLASNSSESKYRRATQVLAAVGVVVYCAGIGLAGHPAVGVGMRAAGVAVLLLATVRQASLTAWTFFAILAGAELGADAPRVAVHLHVLAEIFLRLIRMIVAPLILGTLTTGIAGHVKLSSLGRVAWKTFLYFEVVTTLALVMGAAAIHVTHAGEGMVMPAMAGEAPPALAHPGLETFLLNMFPENIALAVAQNQILQVAVFAIFFGVALSLLPEEKKAPMLTVLQSLTATMFQLTKLIMYAAPLAAGAAMAYTIGSMGMQTLLPLAKLVGTFYGAVAGFTVLVLLPIAVLTKIPLRGFVQAVGEPAAIGFATSSSEAALPLAMERMEEFGVPRWIVSFVIPAGYSFNMDGSSLYLSVASIFAARVSGIPMTLGSEAVMLATLMVTSKGVGGVPRATLAILLATAATFHLAPGPLMMIVGVDALIDMGRTAMNVTGNCLASAAMGRWEGSGVEDVALEEAT